MLNGVLLGNDTLNVKLRRFFQNIISVSDCVLEDISHTPVCVSLL